MNRSQSAILGPVRSLKVQTSGFGTVTWLRKFEVHPQLKNPHIMTIAGHYWPRNLSGLCPATERLIEVEHGTYLLAKCHWHIVPQKHSTIVLVHGLEGSSESSYMLGIAKLAYCAGFNVLRMNQRTCGGTEHLTPTFYDSGLSRDYKAVLDELVAKDGLFEIFFAGYSIGGNLVLKMAGEFGDKYPKELHGICAVSPCLDLALSAKASGQIRTLLYELYLLQSIRNRMQRKAKLFPDRYNLNRMPHVRTLRQWDENVTAPACGYRDAAEYYYHASALRVIDQIHVRTLILTAQDDPIVPIESLDRLEIARHPFIAFLAPEHGGHCAFISSMDGDERFWAERRVVEFCIRHSRMSESYSQNSGDTV